MIKNNEELYEFMERLETLLSAESCFEVEPKTIDLGIIKQLKIKDYGKNAVRMIFEAYEQVEKFPSKYSNKFKVVIPDSDLYQGKTYHEIREILGKSGAHIADWTEISLYWAQRIVNDRIEFIHLCGEVDQSKCRRVFISYDGNPRCVGGSELFRHRATYIDPWWCSWSEKKSFDCVPLIVKYDEN